MAEAEEVILELQRQVLLLAARMDYLETLEASAAAAETTLTLQPGAADGQDTYTNEGAANADNSATVTLEWTGFAGIRRFTLIKFDLSSIPAGSTINSATLTLYGQGTGQVNKASGVHRILAANSAWTEAATWNYAVPSTVRWAGDVGGNGGTDAGCSVSGTDWSATSMATFIFDRGDGVANEIALDVTEFTTLLANNYGLLVRATESATSSPAQPASSDNTTVAKRPKLVVNYTIP